MSDTPDLPSNTTSDSLVDSLLTETARNGQSADEDFLRSVESVIEAPDEAPPVPFRPLTKVLLATAAALVLGLGTWLAVRNGEAPEKSESMIAESPKSKKKEEKAALGHQRSSVPESPQVSEAEANQIAQRYVIRLQERTKKADEAALRGSKLMASHDFQGAIDQYRAALDLLPDAPMTEPRRRAYVKQYARATVLLATQRADEGRYPEALALVESVLQPSIDHDNIDARRLLEKLNDTDYFTTITPQNLDRARRIKLAWKTAQGYIDLGDYDRADEVFHKALNGDPYNVAARRGQVRNERHRLDYYDQAYNHTRTRFLREVASGWEMPVPSETVARSKIVIPIKGSSLPQHANLADNTWASPLESPLSTFSIDVDTASWTNIRGMIRNGVIANQIPDDSVRIEEMINYFDWDYPQPDGEHPFAFSTETATSPWNAENQILRVGIQGRSIEPPRRPDANLVFLLDVSGSMDQPNKLPLVKQTISVLVEELKENDRISIAVYSGAEGLALDTVSGRNQQAIQNALENLAAGGSTNGGAGIKLAYSKAREQFIEGGINRVILCTDGEFNVGLTGDESLVELVEKEAEAGVFLTVCGFGSDNINDSMLEKITNKGNGNYFFIDTLREGRKVFLRDLMSTLVTIAKDVKIQIEFNPARVKSYRLIGYANRMLKAEDFENDEIDAGEVGAGHTVTALYEIVPAGGSTHQPVDKLRYQKQPKPEVKLTDKNELALVKLRYKQPDKDTSIPMEHAVIATESKWEDASKDFRFATSVALFGMILRENESAKNADLSSVIELAKEAIGPDPHGERTEFVDVVWMLEKQSSGEQK